MPDSNSQRSRRSEESDKPLVTTLLVDGNDHGLPRELPILNLAMQRGPPAYAGLSTRAAESDEEA